MPPRHPLRPLPRLWLMTDERMGEALWASLAALPKGSGVVFRHYATPPGERDALFGRVARVARRRRLVLLRAGTEHGRDPRRSRTLKTWPAHDAREVVAGRRAGADLIFLSPIFATRSHPGGHVLGRVRALGLVRLAGDVPVIALGGMNAQRFRSLAEHVYGWAAIDSLIPTDNINQKRSAVPI